VLDALTKGYLTLHPAAAARTLARLDIRDLKAVFQGMPRPLAASVIEHMTPGSIARCLSHLQTRAAAEILVRIPSLTAVAALRLMNADLVKVLFSAMPRPAAARLRLRLRYPETLIGSFVDAEALTLSVEQRVGDALRLVRRTGQRTGHTLYVIDEHRHLAGVVDLCDLLGERDRSKLQRVLHPAPVVLNARAALQTVTNHPAWLTHDSLPVVNREGLFQGVLARTRVMTEEQQLLTEVAERNELTTTRAALADIFWLGVAAVFTANSGISKQRRMED
jgi:Mg/Co/Ni transporter MgtE